MNKYSVKTVAAAILSKNIHVLRQRQRRRGAKMKTSSAAGRRRRKAYSRKRGCNAYEASASQRTVALRRRPRVASRKHSRHRGTGGIWLYGLRRRQQKANALLQKCRGIRRGGVKKYTFSSALRTSAATALTVAACGGGCASRKRCNEASAVLAQPYFATVLG